MTIKNILSFDSVRADASYGSQGALDPAKVFWGITGTGTINTYAGPSTYGGVVYDPIPFGQGGNYSGGQNLLSYTTQGAYISKSIPDDSYVCVGGGVNINWYEFVDQVFYIRGSSNWIAFGLNGRLACIWIDGSIAATSTVDVSTGRPWQYVELIADKATNKARLNINGVEVANAAWTPFTIDTISVKPTKAIATTRGGASPCYISEVVYSTGASVGPVKVVDYFKTTDAVAGFSGATSAVNTKPWNAGTYRSSDTQGTIDRFTYGTNILKAGDPTTSIVAVQHNIVASSSGVGGGMLNMRIRIGTTDYDTSISSYLTSTTPVLIQKLYETSVATGVAWTRSEVQGIQTGYIVNP